MEWPAPPFCRGMGEEGACPTWQAPAGGETDLDS
jgi:hypothetical protein